MKIGVERETALAFAATLATAGCLALGLGPAAAAEPGAAPAAASPPGLSLELLPIDPPAPPGASAPALAAENVTTLRRDHDVLMTWLEPGEGGGRLRFARLSDDTWTEPVTVAAGVAQPVALDPPTLTVLDTQGGVRRTLVVRTGDVVARSGDAGRTWTRLPAPPLPFASLAGGDEGGYAFWLAPDGDGAAKLLGTRLLAGETVLDVRVAPGSGTSAVMTWDGPVVVYRDHGVDGAQDVAVVRRKDARWTPPRPVHVEGWAPLAGVPASGPRVAAERRQVAVAWYTEAAELPHVLVAFSSDGGGTFGAPVEVAAGEGAEGVPSGLVDVALDDGGNALVLWTAGTGSGDVALNLARVSPDGRRGEEVVLADGLSAGPESAPRIARAGERVAAAWVEGEPGRLRAVVLPLAGLPAAERRRPARAVRAGSEVEPGSAPAAYRGRGRVGDLVPDDELVSLAGDAVSLASLAGRPVLLNLWATWCVPCLAEMPELAELQERFGPEGLAVVGVSVDDEESLDQVRAFVSEGKVRIPVWLDPQMQVYRALRVRGLPATFVVDREGRILLRHDGPITADDSRLRAALRRALGGSPEAPRERPGNG